MGEYSNLGTFRGSGKSIQPIHLQPAMAEGYFSTKESRMLPVISADTQFFPFASLLLGASYDELQSLNETRDNFV